VKEREREGDSERKSKDKKAINRVAYILFIATRGRLEMGGSGVFALAEGVIIHPLPPYINHPDIFHTPLTTVTNIQQIVRHTFSSRSWLIQFKKHFIYNLKTQQKSLRDCVFCLNYETICI